MSPSQTSTREKHYINSGVVIVHQEKLIQEAVQEMINRNISSILVEDDHGLIVGIITERDIVRKFTLLDMSDKLTRTVGTIMTRPVAFVHQDHFHEQIVKLHLEKRIRHFPVLSSTEPRKENLVGIVSITDVARHYMTQGSKSPSTGAAPAHEPKHGEITQGRIVHVLTSIPATTNSYLGIFKNLGFIAKTVASLQDFIATNDGKSKILIIDLDGFSDSSLHDLIPIAIKAKCYLLMTTSKPQLVPIFKKYFDHDHQEIAMKPLDLSYVSWLLQTKWT